MIESGDFPCSLTRTLLAWPVALAIVFLIWCGVIERFGGGDTASDPSAFVETWLLILFAAQVVGVLVVIARLLKLVAPAQVMSMVQATFADNLRRSIGERLLCKFALRSIQESSTEAGMRLRAFGGTLVTAGKPGWVDDVDLRR